MYSQTHECVDMLEKSPQKSDSQVKLSGAGLETKVVNFGISAPHVLGQFQAQEGE